MADFPQRKTQKKHGWVIAYIVSRCFLEQRLPQRSEPPLNQGDPHIYRGLSILGWHYPVPEHVTFAPVNEELPAMASTCWNQQRILLDMPQKLKWRCPQLGIFGCNMLRQPISHIFIQDTTLAKMAGFAEPPPPTLFPASAQRKTSPTRRAEGPSIWIRAPWQQTPLDSQGLVPQNGVPLSLQQLSLDPPLKAEVNPHYTLDRFKKLRRWLQITKLWDSWVRKFYRSGFLHCDKLASGQHPGSTTTPTRGPLLILWFWVPPPHAWRAESSCCCVCSAAKNMLEKAAHPSPVSARASRPTRIRA